MSVVVRVKLVGENVGIGVDDAEKIVERVRDEFNFRGGPGIRVCSSVLRMHFLHLFA